MGALRRHPVHAVRFGRPGARSVSRGCGDDPGITVVTPYEWSADHSWKDKVFSKAQPFLDPEATRTWLERKETYRALKGTGTI